MGDHDSILTDPEILACVKSSRRVLAPVQPLIARVPVTTFLRKGGGRLVQQLGHETDNSPSSHDVIKIRRNFQNLSICFDVVLRKQKKITAILPWLAVRIKLLRSCLIFHISEGKFLLLFRVCYRSL